MNRGGANHFREFTEVEIVNLRRHARGGGDVEDALEMAGLGDRKVEHFRRSMRNRYGIQWKPARRLAHNGDVTTIGKGAYR